MLLKDSALSCFDFTFFKSENNNAQSIRFWQQKQKIQNSLNCRKT
ncbi:hypothetical protein CZ797_00540 [Pseudoalteromonas sp. JB197]|nr:hypothetical protein CZ797_00540 [Pseudoalteromonas sp. JB197]